ncbi:MAG: hypothetical protein M3178_14285 [Pseudomonadota bacterium]|nr:hypothetical protein [Pseudomonadota bacterium]
MKIDSPFGPAGMAHIDPLLDGIQADESVPALATSLHGLPFSNFSRNHR